MSSHGVMNFPVDRLVEEGGAAERRGEREEAIRLYAAATRQLHRHWPAKLALDRIAAALQAEAAAAEAAGEEERAIALMVRAVELNPDSQEARDGLGRLIAHQPPRRDLTTECLIFPDAERADAFYRQAIRTCLEFVVYNGIDGNVFEFGVLAGWTARRFAEAIRDMHYLCDLHLFDSFEGLPRRKHEWDEASYDVRRGVWKEEMKLPDSWIEQIGGPFDAHVAWALSRVISRERIHVRRGFFSDTLREPLHGKAAIVHFDCDLYQSTKEVIDALVRDAVLQDGTMLMFDDWNCNRGNPAFGQRRALREFLDSHRDRYSVSHYLNYGFNCAAFILHEHPADARALAASR
jgi:hypothetical protein